MEGVMHELSKCGKFQVGHVTMTQLCRFVTGWAFSVMIFGLYNPGWHCDDERDSNSTLSMLAKSRNNQPNGSHTAFPQTFSSITTTSVFLPLDDRSSPGGNRPLGLSNFSNGRSSNHSYYNEGDGNVSNSSFYYSSSCDAIATCDAIKFNPESSTIVSEFGLVCDKVWVAYTIVAVLNFGMLFGAFAWGAIGERFGRTVGLYGSCLMVTLACGLAVFSPVWQVYAAFTFLIGFGTVGTVAACSTLCMEFLDSKWRARLASFPVWDASVLSFAFVTYFLRDWRHIHIVTAVLCGVGLLGFFWTPESLRWLQIHGKTTRTKKVVDKISKLNKVAIPPEMLAQFMETSSEFKENKSKNYTYLDLFRTRDLRLMTIKITVVSIVLSVSYDLLGFGIQALPGDFYVNLVVASLIELPGTLLVGFLAVCLGRRWTSLLFELSGVVCSLTIVVALLVMDKGQSRDIMVTSMAFINKTSVQANMDLMMTYTAELVPTAVRNLTFGFTFTLARAACIASPYLLPRDHASMVTCFAVLVSIQLLAVVVFFSLPETKDKPIDDTIRQKPKVDGRGNEEDRETTIA